MRHKALKIGSAIAVIALVAAALGALSFGPLVRMRVQSSARARGFDVQVGRVDVTKGSVLLHDVELTCAEIPSVRARFDVVEVRVGAALSPRAVEAHGGMVQIRGSPRQVAREVRAWRAKRSGGSGGGSTLPVSVDGLAVVWREALPDAAPQYAWGVAARRADGRESVSADLVRLSHSNVDLEIGTGRVELRRHGGVRVIDSFTSQRLVVRAELKRETFDGLAGLIRAVRSGADSNTVDEQPGSRDGEPAVSAVAAGASGDAPPATSAREAGAGVPIGSPKSTPPSGPGDRGLADGDEAKQTQSSRGPRLRRRLGKLARLVRAMLPETGVFELDGLTVRLRRGASELGVGPGRLSVRAEDGNVALAFVPAGDGKSAPASKRAPLRIELTIPVADGPVDARVKGGPVSLAALGVDEGSLGLRKVDGATVAADGTAQLAADGTTLGVAGKFELGDLTVEQDWLAARAVTASRVAWKGRASLALDGSRLHVEESDVRLGNVSARFSGEVERGADWTRADVRGELPLASCSDLLDAAPRGLIPLVREAKLRGTFGFSGELRFDTRKPGETHVSWDLDNQCRFGSTPPDIAPMRFRSSFTREVPGPNGRQMRHTTGPGSPNWVSLGYISPHMQTAVLICEDGRFFRHGGFDHEAIRNSIKENIKAGRFVRGASTISMQLAKNLYLSRRKTLSRKLQEALLTMLLEQELSKAQMMELYLNVIEYAPGVYGIGPAASHYFNTSASRLSLGQALYMASILSNPKRQHFGGGGAVTPGWSSYLRRLMKIGVKIGRVSEEELEEGLREVVTFGVPVSPLLPPEDEEGIGENGEAAEIEPPPLDAEWVPPADPILP